MPIPAVTSAEVILRVLLDKQAEDFEEPVSVEELMAQLPTLDVHPSDECRILPRSVQCDIEFLERHRLLKFMPSNPHVQLTPLGVYTALLFEVPDDPAKPDL